MFASIVLILSLLYCSPSSGQNSTLGNQPTLGEVYVGSTNSSLLNFTYSYPTNYQFLQLGINFTLYDFNGSNGTFTTYPFATLTFANNNYSLPWVAPPTFFPAGDYVIACFQWTRMDNNNTLLSSTYECLLTRAPNNSAIPPVATPFAQVGAVNGTTVSLSIYSPRELPYDQLEITVSLNNMAFPQTSNQSSNGTYSFIYTYTFTNVTFSSNNSACLQYDYANSQIAGSNETYMECIFFQASPTVPATTPSTAPATTSPTSTSNRIASSFLSMILLVLMTYM